VATLHTVLRRRVGKSGEYVLSCHRCHQPIEYGQPYRWFKLKQARGGIKRAFHPGCPIRPSDRTTSRLGQVWDAQDAFDAYVADSAAELQGMLELLAETVTGVADEYRESVDAMEQGFGHRTSQADELEERAQALDVWAEDLQEWEPSVSEPPDRDDFPEGEDGDEEHAEAEEAWLEEIRSEADGLARGCPV
jgi:hypothetical protein